MHYAEWLAWPAVAARVKAARVESRRDEVIGPHRLRQWTAIWCRDRSPLPQSVGETPDVTWPLSIRLNNKPHPRYRRGEILPQRRCSIHASGHRGTVVYCDKVLSIHRRSTFRPLSVRGVSWGKAVRAAWGIEPAAPYVLHGGGWAGAAWYESRQASAEGAFSQPHRDALAFERVRMPRVLRGRTDARDEKRRIESRERVHLARKFGIETIFNQVEITLLWHVHKN